MDFTILVTYCWSRPTSSQIGRRWNIFLYSVGLKAYLVVTKAYEDLLGWDFLAWHLVSLSDFLQTCLTRLVKHLLQVWLPTSLLIFVNRKNVVIFVKRMIVIIFSIRNRSFPAVRSCCWTETRQSQSAGFWSKWSTACVRLKWSRKVKR